MVETYVIFNVLISVPVEQGAGLTAVPPIRIEENLSY